MIRLTKKDGLPLYISPENLTSVGQSEVSKGSDPFDLGAGKELVTVVVCGEDSSVVTESPEEIARKMLEWRLEMEDYKASLNAAYMKINDNEGYDTCIDFSVQANKSLHRLAGIES